MKESEYLKVYNLARLRVAMTIIGQCQPDYGVTREQLRELANQLEELTKQIVKQIEVEE